MIPRCMSTQHPDNVNPPFFASSPLLSGEDEIKEAYYVFSHLGCDEQMWDCEGKEVDNYVVKKLLANYKSFFQENILGEDYRLTLRVPNPTIEREEAKILLETLESIPRSYDTATLFYGMEVAPVFEVILPMTSSSTSLNRIYNYYKKFVVEKQNFSLGDVTIKEWIGEFKPQSINVIPLFEDYDGMLSAANITREYLDGKNIHHQRVFLARSDPAMNYGMISAIILNKIALQNFEELEKETGIRIYPIIGMGSAPFRGNLKPSNVDNVIKEYPNTYTFTLQSSFKYDHPPREVIRAVDKLKSKKPGKAHEIEAEVALEIMQKYCREYRRQVLKLADTINQVAKYVPKRRKRKLHIGLFGYSRSIGKVSLPRAITFTAALYSIGVPPEILGFNALSDKDIEHLHEIYINLEKDMLDALRYMNPDSPYLEDELHWKVKEHFQDIEYDIKHKKLVDDINKSLSLGQIRIIQTRILEAASLRRFLG
ncbi:MAG TPA: phosphoenolpyruvate carboxylase [Methanothermobacter sp.]|nr:phosphoenolpyruvate carboxylase [Methanothermobacter tenebrarum]MDD3454280.1 phosphoenolpyruvate carboxylase [Methanobacteriales archaeon]MDI6881925.1 phosphoenolpyruvate carboxylase [Methanothermobacter sp.]MDX9692729.1 phosphoenolpyruvate carboxylase [Methanothermobacter sp.]HHW16970.1 phosphoenolpyruvate carboxylase [Methanothermobacter sp.]HOQ20252.1 phosphoenolpyruvate carboxylase [Methanothermobacter sp.]